MMTIFYINNNEHLCETDCFFSLQALHKLETAANKLAKVVAEEAPGTLSSLKLSFLEINDLTSQLKNLR
jgi:hypothetical protein